MAIKHNIYLSKNYSLSEAEECPLNVFMFNESGAKIQAQWVKKNIEQNKGCFIVYDHGEEIWKEIERPFIKKNYYVEKVDFSKNLCRIKINPFDLVKNTSEIHFMFLNFIYAMWDNTDPDISAMSNLIDAFASCVYYMFEETPEKRTMHTLKKMISSVRAVCQTENGSVPMCDAIFANIADQDSMPCKYYAQFKKAADDRWEDVAEKLASMFDEFSDADLDRMSATDPTLYQAFRFKTAVHINVNKEEYEKKSKLIFVLLHYLIQHIPEHAPTILFLDKLPANYAVVSLPHWLKEGPEHNMTYLVACDNLTVFQETPRRDKYFRNLQKVVGASVLVHHDETALKFEEELPTSEDDMNEYAEHTPFATVLVPHKELSVQDEIF